MSYSNRIAWEPIRTIDSATMVSAVTYYPFLDSSGNPSALLFPSYKLKMVNNSNVLVTVSITGLTNSDIDVCPGNSFWLYDETQAQISTANCPAIPAGTQIFCKTSAAGVGLIYLVSQYLVQG